MHFLSDFLAARDAASQSCVLVHRYYECYHFFLCDCMLMMFVLFMQHEWELHRHAAW
jgi:hypothetical protein